MGNGKMAERGGGRRDFFGDGGDGRPRGSPLPVLVGVRRDGCPHARGDPTGGGGLLQQRDSSAPLRCARNDMLSGGMRDGSPHPRGQREGSGFPSASSRGQAIRGGTGVGPRIREDTGGMDSRLRLHGGRQGGRGRGWAPASARTMGGDGFPSASSRGQAVSGGGGGGVPASARTREGMDSRLRLHGGKL